MIDHGIDVKTFYKKGLLHIYKIPNLLNHPKGVLKGSDEFLNKIFSRLKPPFRIVGRIVDELDTEEQVRANLSLEKHLHPKFTQFNGLVLCTYDVLKIPRNTRGRWVKAILNNHHSAIFVTETSEQGIAFDMV